jgi:hypothetical protein
MATLRRSMPTGSDGVKPIQSQSAARAVEQAPEGKRTCQDGKGGAGRFFRVKLNPSFPHSGVGLM